MRRKDKIYGDGFGPIATLSISVDSQRMGQRRNILSNYISGVAFSSLATTITPKNGQINNGKVACISKTLSSVNILSIVRVY